MQFKLVHKDTMKTHNTISFVNIPSNKMADPNVVTLLDILQKQNKVNAGIVEKKVGAPYEAAIKKGKGNKGAEAQP